MFFIKIYIKESYMNYYDTSIQMCGQYCILAPYFTLMGGHALASPKGGRPCSLGTFNYGVASHLAFRLT